MNSLKSLIKPITFLVIFISLSACNSGKEVKLLQERKVSFNNNWQFHLNDSTDNDTISNSTTWRNLNLPHDYSIEQPFDINSPTGFGGGALRGGLAWYKKTFTVDDSTKLTSIAFDGVYENSEVWINGNYLGKRPNGYSSFEYNLTPYLNYGDQKNEILVKVDNSNQPNSRWYSGSGIYRNVWLKTTNKIHVAHWGTFITTPMVNKESASVNLQVTIANNYPDKKDITTKTTIYKDNSEIVSFSEIKKSISGNEHLKISTEGTIENPSLWSPEHPEMYTAITEIYADGNLVDEYKTPFGIRNFTFDLEKGFILNGEQVKIKGVCLHHDLGPLGTAINTRALERQLQIMKDMGVNGIRTSHNPPAPELLDLCDSMGFIVMDEAYDMWEQKKTTYDYANFWEAWHKRDLEDLILRDRNHPSVFMWSIGNEIPEQWSERGAEIGRELSKIVKNLDTTRYVTAAMNPPVHVTDESVTVQFENTADKPNALAGSGALDIIGYNYAHQTYPKHQVNFPNTPFIATETTSGLQTRGYYEFPSDTTKIWPVRWDIKFTDGNDDNTVSAFDQVRTPWGSLHETTWKVIKKHDFLSGMFVWTGFDYIGEPTPYEWPSRSSYFGIVDLAGFPKNVYYMYQSEWTDKDVLYLLPHWNWEEGQTVDVWAYYNHADEVELFLNGKSMGVKSKKGDDLHVMWRFPFKAGTLKAVSRKDENIVKETEIKTADVPAKLELLADRTNIIADGSDLSFITVNITDKNGTIAPRANHKISFSVEGPGEIVGVASGDPTNHESFKGTSHKALNGKCLVIVQSTEKAGTIQLTASADGLATNTISITTK
ncbi:beta-galactosidase [Pustulibacterium marinum]|uniref:Beta-galactosidase n=1 Tax=Pustulibacterium marinum TaxID=1224947 RepID=A0A1I7I0U2_9FLAO|nr:beta-galactosidase GalB [Pustulibacterium marinum]SFU66589.1 beta-galactosidase [Pustulibacterium marinum]